MATLADAVHYAHQRGVIHRDLKPSNILIDLHGQPRITDFGLAKQLAGDSDMTLTGQVPGSPNYLPPEQASGKRGDIGVHSDVYSLGAIFYHLLAGRPPFAAATLQETLAQVLNQEPVAPRLSNPGVPLDLETICLKCLEKESANRYRSAEELAEELNRFLRDEAILARPIPKAERAWRWCRRNPVVASLSGATILLLLGVLIGSPIAVVRISRESEKAKQSAEQDRRKLVRLAFFNGVFEYWMSQNSAAALAHFWDGLKIEEGDPEQEQIHRMRMERVLELAPKLIQAWFLGGDTDGSEFRGRANDQFSPDGRRVATVSGRWQADGSRREEVRIWDAFTGQATSPPLLHTGRVYAARFSPDGRWLVTASSVFAKDGSGVSGHAQVWDASTGAPAGPPLRHDGAVADAVFSPDSRQIATATRRRTQSGSLESDALIWEAVTGALLHRFPHSHELMQVRYSADGQRILTAGSQWSRGGPEAHYVQAWAAATGDPINRPVSLKGSAWEAKFSPDGACVLTSAGESAKPWEVRWQTCHLHLLDVITGGSAAKPIECPKYFDAAFSPDGRRVALAGIDGSGRIWDTATGHIQIVERDYWRPASQIGFSPNGRLTLSAVLDGSVQVQHSDSGKRVHPSSVLPHNAGVLQASFSPDGRRVLTRTSDQVARLWEFPAEDRNGAVLQHQGPVRHVEFSKDGQRILTACADGAARVWDSATLKPVLPPLVHSNALVQARFSRDDRFVVTASQDHSARIWNAATGEPVTPRLQHKGIVWSAQFNPEGRRILTASGSFFEGRGRFRLSPPEPNVSSGGTDSTEGRSGEARGWDSVTGSLLLTMAHADTVTHAEYSPDGRRIATACLDGTARVWDASTGQPMTPPLRHDMSVMHIAFSPDGRFLVTAVSGEPFAPGYGQVWDATTGKAVFEHFRHDDGVLCARFSPDGKYLATAGSDGATKLWNAKTGQLASPPLRQQRGQAQVDHLAFSPNNRLVVTSSTISQAQIFESATGREVTLPCLSHAGPVRHAMFSPDGRWVASASDSGVVRLWNLLPYDLAKEDLLLVVQVLSAHQGGPASTHFEPLSSAAFSNAWHTLRAKHPRLFVTPEAK